jgi:hypothetical protein
MSTKYTTWHGLCRILRVFIVHACTREFVKKCSTLRTVTTVATLTLERLTC